MYSNTTKLHDFESDLDHPHISIGVRLFLYIRPAGPYFGLGFIGVLLWLLTYMIMYFYRDFLVTHLKKESDRGYYYKYLEYKKFSQHVFGFSFIVFFFWIVILLVLNEWRFYMFTVGGFFFLIFYVCYLVKYYLIDKNDFDFFDDWVYLYKRMTAKKNIEKIKKD